MQGANGAIYRSDTVACRGQAAGQVDLAGIKRRCVNGPFMWLRGYTGKWGWLLRLGLIFLPERCCGCAKWEGG